MNEHGPSLLEFLCDNALCVLNGIFGLDSNKYTSISTRGSAVVDYAIVRQSDVHLFSKFDIITMSEVSDVVKHLISDRSRIPDHSILVCDLIISEYTRGTTLPVDTKQTCDKSRCEFIGAEVHKN